MRLRTLCVVIVLGIVARAAAVDHFAENVRTTEPLTPDQEQKVLHVPPGFEVQLVASEPDIAKPINMAFDARGRLWITQSREYPFPVKPGAKARDAIQVLEDFGPDGKARKITTFADGLNIPIGVYPYENGAIGYSIPYVYRFQDTTGDGHADVRDILFGPYDYSRDTHGMTGGFRRGFDGWLYACHGFNNITTLKGTDGQAFTMSSGNTYRMRLDGSHVEQYTWGQVNPFGMTFDSLGNMYTADCETLPIYQLLRGAYYPSFGKPDDGLGFGPQMMNHKHGSTAIGGIAFLGTEHLPAEFRENILVGNVVTCRVNRDSLEDHGSTRIAHEQPDLVQSDDPWFRPVDLQWGPDGALYVADFYNRIIGHYEVPLDHKGRDRERGRIWRIVYRGDSQSPPAIAPDLTKASVAELIAALGQSNLTVRMLATSQLTDRIGKAAIEPVSAKLHGDANATQKVHGLWVLWRLGALPDDLLVAATKDEDRAVRTHAMKILSETQPLTAAQHALVVTALKDPDAFVERAAADALGQHPNYENLRPLLDLRARVPADDTHLLHVVRMALRNQLRSDEIFGKVVQAEWQPVDLHSLADVTLGVPSATAGAFLLKHLDAAGDNRELAGRYVRHAARYLPPSEVGSLARAVKAKFADDLDFQLALFKSVQEGAAQRGVPLPAEANTWAGEMIEKILAAKTEVTPNWTNRPIPGSKNTTDPWTVQKRNSADGRNDQTFYSSLPRGEQLTGILRSNEFKIPDSLSFFVAGHNGQPPKEFPVKNLVRLCEAQTDKVLMEAPAPRNDVAVQVKWDLKPFAGKQGYLELIDADTGTGFAWIAAGRFEPPVVRVPGDDALQFGQRRIAAIDMISSLGLVKFAPQLTGILNSPDHEIEVRAAAAKALTALSPETSVAQLAALLADEHQPDLLREKIAQTLGSSKLPAANAALLEAIRNAPERSQAKLALALVGTKEGGEALLQTVADGKLTPRILQDRAVRDRLAAVQPDHWNERLEKLTQGLPALDVKVQQLIDARRAAYNPDKASAEAGSKLFEKHCQVCHRLDGKGQTVGPNLDGIGARGLDRILEDVLDPSRNVDPAFRTSVVRLTNGQVFSGLQRREEGAVIVFADNTGKEVSIPKTDIEERKESKLSLMPSNVGETLAPEDFNHLLAFLLSKRVAPKP